ncbi:MAG TPA: prephenate dehydrogenase [Bryobacteraceae bacterium]|jgi:prephenate dehydrogenase
MQVVAIAGVGLIGGSFALALRKAGFSGRILGVSSERTIAEAVRLGVIDEGVTLERAQAEADVIYLAQPILQIIEVVGRLRPKPGALVTDAGSTKARICEAAGALKDCQFIGGHPMAGKETRGVAAADADLFRGRNYILTPTTASDAKQDWLRAQIESFGAIVTILEPEEHDRLVAHTSHLPQILSTILANTLAPVASASRVAGPALLDMTRIAQSPFDMWHDIFVTNREPIEQALAAFLSRFTETQSAFYRDEFARAFEEAARVANGLRRVKDL